MRRPLCRHVAIGHKGRYCSAPTVDLGLARKICAIHGYGTCQWQSYCYCITYVVIGMIGMNIWYNLYVSVYMGWKSSGTSSPRYVYVYIYIYKCELCIKISILIKRLWLRLWTTTSQCWTQHQHRNGKSRGGFVAWFPVAKGDHDIIEIFFERIIRMLFIINPQ